MLCRAGIWAPCAAFRSKVWTANDRHGVTLPDDVRGASVKGEAGGTIQGDARLSARETRNASPKLATPQVAAGMRALPRLASELSVV